MKKFFKVLSLALVATTLSFGFTACSDDDEEGAAATKNQVSVTFGDESWSANYLSAKIDDGDIVILATSKNTVMEMTATAEGLEPNVQYFNYPAISVVCKADEGTFEGDDVSVEYYNTADDTPVLVYNGVPYYWGWQGEDVTIIVSELSSTSATLKVSANVRQMGNDGNLTGATKALTATFTNVTLVEVED